MCTVFIGPYIIYSLEHYIDQTTAHMNYIKLLYACTVHASYYKLTTLGTVVCLYVSQYTVMLSNVHH